MNCSITDCQRKYYGRKYCNLHYQRWRKGKLSRRSPYEPNEIRVVGDTAYMDLYDRLGSVRATAEFDSNKIDLVSEHKWWLLTGGYVACHAKGGKNLRLHRLVTGWVDAGQYIDHIDGNPLNNRCDNLRLVSQSINLGNMHRKPSSNSGYMGVYFDKKRGNYQAHVGHHGTTIHLGRYKTAEEAAAAYNAKKIELFGEHASLNVLD